MLLVECENSQEELVLEIERSLVGSLLEKLKELPEQAHLELVDVVAVQDMVDKSLDLKGRVF